ncbi:MAG: hypothetical protein ABIR06_08020 [Cyclobacteriaceae bacterium]
MAHTMQLRRLINAVLLILITATSNVVAQIQHGLIRYEWQSPTKILLTGEEKPVITLGDSVSITLTGTVNLRPYTVQKKKGGFLGIGAKRYKEIHDNVKDVSKVNVYTEVTGTRIQENSRTIVRTFVLTPEMLTDDVIASTKREYYLSTFIAEGGKNPSLGWSKVDFAVKIETLGRIKHILDYLKSEKPSSFAKIQEVIEAGNLVKQHPNELASALLAHYKQHQPEVLNRIKKDFFEYLITKSPSNVSVRSELANVYIEDLQFTAAQSEAKKVLSDLENRPDDQLTKEQIAALASAYKTLGDVSSLEKLGTQKNAYSLAARYFKESAHYYGLNDSRSEQEGMVLKQIKCLQNVGTVPALAEAATVLTKYLEKQSN